MESLIGRNVGRYRILAELGRGGMGVVYRALDTTLGREVALKVLPPDLVADDDRRRRFLREAQTASQLEHAHIGVIHEVGEADGVSFIAMELVRGEPLSQAIARGALAPARTLELAAEIAEGLARAHEHGVVHRDLKPANVMVTDDGHAKIIDFGLAKSLDSGAPSSDAATIAASTDIGVIKGTTSYMSPEQTRGERLDARSDLFSFGVMLYQMLSGRLPFHAPSYVDTLHAISHSEAPPLVWSASGGPPDAQQDVQRLLDKCLAKDPAARYQTARDLVVDLRSARRRLEAGSASTSTSLPAATVPARASWVLVAGGAALAIAMITAGVGIYRAMRTQTPAVTDTSKPSLAVLYFQNNTGNPQLDWLRTGLTDMVVTDLAQSPDIEVLGTDRLYQILSALKRQNDAVVSFDTVQELARRAGVKHVLLGSYVKSGDAIRINITLQEAESGKILTADRLDAASESTLFSTVDDLTQRVKAKFALTDRAARNGPPRLEPAAAPGEPGSSAGYFRELSEVTTASTEAYRYYVLAIDLHQRGQEKEAEPLFQKALEVDPKFALAMTKLAVVENNLGHDAERIEYAKRAVEHLDRLSPRERYYIEGYYYSLRSETMAKAIESYQQAVSLYADHVSAKHNLAVLYGRLERYDEAIALYEQIIRRRASFAFTYSNLIGNYTAMGQFDAAERVWDNYVRETPPSPVLLRRWGRVLVTWQKYDDARAAVAKADTLDAGDPQSDFVRFGADVLEGRWADAAAIAKRESQLADPYWKWAGGADTAAVELYSGRAAAAFRALEASAVSQGPGGSNQGSISRMFAAAYLLALARPAEALAQAEQGLKESQGGGAEWGCLYFLALAQSRAGRAADAAKTIDTLTAKANTWPSQSQRRAVHELQGVLALDRRDTATAVSELLQAESMLRPRSHWDGDVPHVWIWFDLGSALLAAGRDDDAAKRFQLIVDRSEHLYFPIEYVRSLYLLAQIAERRGDRDQARADYRRVVDLWGNGEVDRERVAEARRKIAK